MPGARSETVDSSSQVDPFLVNSTICPICGTKQKQRRLKSHLFIEQDRDIDMYPRKILRKKNGLEQYHPFMYYMWHCPFCHFTSSYTLFAEPARNSSLTEARFAQIIKQKLDSDARTSDVVAILSNDLDLDLDLRDFDSVIRLYLLAIFLLQTDQEVGFKNALTLGRYCLRLAWVFRELDHDASAKQDLQPQLSELMEVLAEDWPNLPGDEQKALQAAALYYMAALRSPGLVETELDELQLILLAARIYLKLGDLAEGRKLWSRASSISKKAEYKVKETLTRVHKAKSELISARNSKYKLLESKEKQLTGNIAQLEAKAVEVDSQSRRMRNLVLEVQDIVFDLEADLIEQQMEQAKALIAKMGDTPPAELRSLLEKKGFLPKVINSLVSEKKSRGFLGLFH
ncbi:MAG: DUF2225 domain-containing protein [Desulfarculaceae bacterium]|jgi:uncharacterized protein (DUF2225 family)